MASQVKAIAAALTSVVWLGLAPVALAAAAKPLPDALRQAERSVVRVVALSTDENGTPVSLDTGSGFVVAPGKVVTNRHVVEGATGASQIALFVIPDRDAGGTSQRVKVTQTWTDADLALLDAPGLTSPPMTIARLAPGKDATVHALGYPGVTDKLLNLPIAQILRPAEPYVTPGSIALFSTIAPGGQKIDTIFHTAPINPGNSGGPLIDACGRVIGVNTWSAGTELGDDGQLTTPQGQFIATRSTVLAKFLADGQIAAKLVDDACTPAADQALQDRLSADEAAIAAQKDELGRDETQIRAETAREAKLSKGVSFGGVILAAALVLMWWLGSRARKAPKARA